MTISSVPSGERPEQAARLAARGLAPVGARGPGALEGGALDADDGHASAVDLGVLVVGGGDAGLPAEAVGGHGVVRQIATRILSLHGYAVIEAPGGEEALAAAAADDRQIDLVVSDVVMPEMSGPELVERLRALYGPVPVLYTSGYTHDFVARRNVLEDGIAAREAVHRRCPAADGGAGARSAGHTGPGHRPRPLN